MAAASAAFVCAGFAIFAGFQWRKAEIQQIQALLQSAETSLVTHEALSARIESLQAAKALKHSFWQPALPEAGLKEQVLGKLSSTIYAAQEINRLDIEENSEDGIRDMVLTPNGRLAIADGKGSVGLWDTKTQKWEKIQNQNTTNTNNGNLRDFRLSPDSQLLAIIKNDDKGVESIYLWDTKTDKWDQLPKSNLVTGDWVSFIGFSPDSQILSAQSRNAAYLWDTKTKKLKNFRVNEGWRAQFSLNGQFLAVILRDYTVSLEDIKTKKQYTLPDPELSKSKIKVNSVKFSPNSQFLAVIGENSRTVHLWDTKTKKWTETLEDSSQPDIQYTTDINNVEFSPDSQFVTIMGENGTIWLRNIKGQQWAKVQEQDSVSRVAFSPTDRLLVTSDDTSIVRLWDTSERGLKVMQAKGSIIENIAFSRDSQSLAARNINDDDNKVTAHWWDTEGKDLPLPQGHQGKVQGVAFSPDGQLLIATTTGDGTIHLWNTKDQQSLKLQGYQGKFQNMVFSPDGQHLAVSSADDKDVVSIWLGNTKDQQLVKLQGYQGKSPKMVFSPDGQHLAVSSADDEGSIISIWLGNTKDQQSVKLQANKVTSMAFSSDSQRLVAVEKDGTIKLWDTKDPEKTMDKPAKLKRGVNSVAFSPNAQVLVTGGSDGSIRLWSIKGQQLAELQGSQPDSNVTSVAFSPNGKLLATNTVHTIGVSKTTYDSTGGGSTSYKDTQNSTLRLWQVEEMDKLVAMNCDWLREYLKNANLSKSDRQLCDGIGTANNPGKAN